MAKLNLHGEHCELSHIQLWCTHGFLTNIHFSLTYTTYHIFHVLPIKHLVNQDSEPTMPQKLATGKKRSVSNQHVLFCPCVVQKATAHVDTKAINMRHQSQKDLVASLLEYHTIKKGTLSTYLVNVK